MPASGSGSGRHVVGCKPYKVKTGGQISCLFVISVAGVSVQGLVGFIIGGSTVLATGLVCRRIGAESCHTSLEP
jgi:hypothetical protein